MDENENKQDQALEDILREFTTCPELYGGEAPEAEPETEEPKAVEEPAFPEDTVTLDLEEIQALLTQMERPEPEEPAGPEPLAEPEAESFSENWEPEYEPEPLGEFFRPEPEPIVFQTRSREEDLSQRLMEGPGRRYHALMESGMNKLQISIFFTFLMTIFGVVSVIFYQFGLVQESRIQLLIYGELFAMLISALLASDRLVDGAMMLLRKRCTPDSLLLISFAACVLDGLLCLKQLRVPYCAGFCLNALCALVAEYQRKAVEISQMDTLRNAKRINRIAKAPGCSGSRPGYCITQGEPEDFMNSYRAVSAPVKQLSRYCMIAVVVCAVIGVLGLFKGGLMVGLRVLTIALLAASPATMFLCQTRPAAILERRLHKVGSVICGWKAVEEMQEPAVVPLSDVDLLPVGSVKLNGVKYYSSRDPDEIIAYATAVLRQSGNAVYPVFERLLECQNGRHYDVSDFQTYDNRGMGGTVNGESVLVGSARFLRDMGISMPDSVRVKYAVYAAVDGEFCAVFALAYGKLRGVSAGLASLCNYQGLTPMLATDNFLLRESFLRSKYGIDTHRVTFLSAAQRRQVAGWNPDPETMVSCALTTQEGLAGAAFAITGARALYAASTWGARAHMIGGLLGMVIVLIVTLTGGITLLTPMGLLVFELICAIPGAIISSWTKNL